MWIDVLAAHSTAILVGVGMPTVVFALFAVADRIDKISLEASGTKFALLRIARYGLGPVCGVVVGPSLLHLILLAKMPAATLVTLLASAVATVWLYWKHQPFSKIELQNAGKNDA
jgi:hypothetical protein